ncbi:MAG: hypothetical protein RLZZ53_608 [Acidobacteriota bacterium]
MAVFWTVPLALLGVSLIALPIGVHLLVRHQVRTLAFPSLRFLRETQLAAFRRQRVENAVLLICRSLIVLLAAVALAGPVLQSASRRAEQSSRVSRAIVTIGPVPDELSTRVAEGAFRSTRVDRASVGDGIQDALRWLEAQPRSRRELVLAGALRRGTVGAVDLAVIPVDVGIRFEQTAADQSLNLETAILARRGNAMVRIAQSVALTADSTKAVDGVITAVPDDLVTIVAGAGEAALAEAALRAALSTGVPWRDFSARVVIVWDGADPSAVAARATGADLIRMAVPDPPAMAADAVRTALRQTGRVEWSEPLTLTPEQLAAWSRAPGEPAADAPVVDEGDRRWLWAIVLLLLGLEWRLRRTPGRGEDRALEEARVA